MDIKLKKSKIVISFLAWMIGGILFITSLGMFLLEGLHGNLGGKLEAAFSGDYQNTPEFAVSMSDYLNDFLSMSVDGPVYGGTGYQEATAAEVTVTETAETVIVEDVEAVPNSTYYPSYHSFSDGDKEQNRLDAQNYNKSMQNDSNILYRIERKGELLYTNEESLGMYGEKDFVMPTENGYNFLMYFDGKKVTVQKDGREINIYGDGYYRDNSNWYVPGYRNFHADDSIEDTRICVVVTDTPGMIVEKNYSGNGSSYYSNALYRIQEEMNWNRDRYTVMLVALVLGMILLAVGICFRREKKEANRAVAAVTGKIWYECRLLVLAGTVFLFVIAFVLVSRGYYYGYYENSVIFMTGLSCLGLPVLWLFFNDMHYNKKPWKNSLLAMIGRVFHTAEIDLPMGKKIIKRYRLVFAASCLLCLAIVVIMLVAMMDTWMYSEYLIPGAVILLPLILLVLGLQIAFAKYNSKMAKEMDLLTNQIEAVYNGKLKEPLHMEPDSDLYEAASHLNEIRKGMDSALEEQMKSERMKVELIANVSHDIKTPLTSIISYVELLKQEENLPEHVQEYVAILESKSQRLKTMIQDVFEVSKAASGELPVKMENLDLGKLLRQTLADMSEQIDLAEAVIKEEIPEKEIMIYADGERLYRVFQNLIQNALKYSLSGSRIFVTLQQDGKVAVASVKNTSKEELPPDFDFTERFARGDKSRSDGGSGLGLSIARSFTEACGGTFLIEVIADLFVVTVSFPEVSEAV